MLYVRYLMLERKMLDKLENWKKRKSKECLMVKGARQVGKTFIIEEFGKKNYDQFIEINFYQHPEYTDIFSKSLMAEEIYRGIYALIPNCKKIDKGTLIFLDEIQCCPNAETALKFLALDDTCDVVVSGSLLGIESYETLSKPVGFVDTIEMFALDFEEFLWALGISKDLVSYLRDCFTKRSKVDDIINDKMFDYLTEYMIVGGMPNIVQKYLKNKNHYDLQKEQDKIRKMYEEDITNHARVVEKAKIRDCYNSIPRQLAKENTKFQYKVVSEKGSAEKYKDSIQWLMDASFVSKCRNVSTPLFPLLNFESTKDFKLYMNDIGLLISCYGVNMKNALYYDKLNSVVSGPLYESLIADILIKKGIPLRYYKNSNSTQEIDFLLEDDVNIIPLEVKAKNGKTISLDNFIDTYKPKTAYKLIRGNVGVEKNKITLPHYMAMFL